MGKFSKTKLALATGAVTVLTSVTTFAADIDVTEGMATITSGGAAIALIGGAMVGLGIGIAVYRKLRNP